MAKSILTGLDLSALPSLTTPKTGSVGFGAKSGGLYQKIGTIESKLATVTESDSKYLPLAGGTLTGNLTAPTFTGALSGNASSATKLQTARTIAGVSFNGTANIAIPFANLSSRPTTLEGYSIEKVAIGGEMGSYAMTGLYDRNMLALADKEATVSITYTGSTIPVQYDDAGVLFNQKSDVFTITNVSADTVMTINISFPYAISNYGHGYWEAFVQYRISSQSVFKSIKVEVADTSGVWHTNNAYTVSDITTSNFEYGLHKSGAYGFGTVSIKQIRFILSNPSSMYLDNYIWIVGLGLRHKSHSYAPQFLHRGEDATLWGKYTFNQLLTTKNINVLGTGSFTGNITAPTFVGALSGNATSSNRLNRLGDNRASFSPSQITGGSLIATFSTQGALANQINDNDYSDVIAVSSYQDSSAGLVNALSFDKNSHRINHFMGTFGASSWDGFKTLAYLTDNVASATKLQTARTIAGVSFDGTANINIPFANLSSRPTTLSGYGITDAVTTDTAQTITASKTFVGTQTIRNGNLVIGGNNSDSRLLVQYDPTAQSHCMLRTGSTYANFQIKAGGVDRIGISAQPTNSYIHLPHSDSRIMIGYYGDANQGYQLGVRGSIFCNSNIVASGEITAYTASDIRLKENVKPIRNALDIVSKLKPRTYNWNERAKELNNLKTGKLDFGLIAQEVEEVLPEIVHDIYDEYKGVDYVKLIPIMIQAIKELKEEISNLKK